MIYQEVNGDIFTVPLDYTLVHCISRDCVMGRGIAKTFKDKYPHMQRSLRNRKEIHSPSGYPALHYYSPEKGKHNVISLVTKEKYFNKPTLNTLADSLNNLKLVCRNLNINKLAMPLIGCGLDKLDWKDVNALIKETFKDEDIDIRVCII